VNVWAVVPVKPLNRAKSRLAAALSAEMREQLAVKMLHHTVKCLVDCSAVSGILVISRDTRALVIAREYGAKTVQESGAPELNPALERASQVIASWNAQAALIIPADIPLLLPADLRELVQVGRYQQSVVVVPDRHESGTNSLLVRPPGMFRYQFGENSFQKHIAAAELEQATVHIFRSERLMLDLDTPDDLLLYLDLCNKYDLKPFIDISPEDLLPYAAMSQKEES
jgi:2-phospho-L-lactate guanylyltransferase